jgi:hypothetical protein
MIISSREEENSSVAMGADFEALGEENKQNITEKTAEQSRRELQ